MLEHAVREYVAVRRGASDWREELEALGQLALILARRLDEGDVTGPLAKELRSTLRDMAEVEEHGDAFDLLAAELSAAVEYPED